MLMRWLIFQSFSSRVSRCIHVYLHLQAESYNNNSFLTTKELVESSHVAALSTLETARMCLSVPCAKWPEAITGPGAAPVWGFVRMRKQHGWVLSCHEKVDFLSKVFVCLNYIIKSTYLDSSRCTDSNGTIIFSKLANFWPPVVPTITSFQTCTL